MSSEDVRARVIVSGLVQGVFYRASARDEARRLGLKGWVMNRRDGKVEAVAEGPRRKLETFIEWCRQGPVYARVADVSTEWSEATGEFRDFGVKY